MRGNCEGPWLETKLSSSRRRVCLCATHTGHVPQLLFKTPQVLSRIHRGYFSTSQALFYTLKDSGITGVFGPVPEVALSKGSYREGAPSPDLRTETDPVSETLCPLTGR
jgi:hypothetical protein